MSTSEAEEGILKVVWILLEPRSKIAINREAASIPNGFSLAIQAAVKTLGGVAGSQRSQGPESGVAGSQCRMVCIRDTLHLGEIWISEALVPEARTCPDIQIVSGLAPLEFDQDGNLL